jgi:hypothetical protein
MMGQVRALYQIAEERARQDAKFPDQVLPSGTGGSWSEAHYRALLAIMRNINDGHAESDEATWESILAEEFFEAMLESDPGKLREELIQVAAVAVRWVENIDRGLA